jgi:uridine phosphorylase
MKVDPPTSIVVSQCRNCGGYPAASCIVKAETLAVVQVVCHCGCAGAIVKGPAPGTEAATGAVRSWNILMQFEKSEYKTVFSAK